MGRKQKLRRERKAAEAEIAAEIASRPPLRFAVGDRVEVQDGEGGYALATVKKTWHKMTTPEGSTRLFPYMCDATHDGVSAAVASDVDDHIRAPRSDTTRFAVGDRVEVYKSDVEGFFPATVVRTWVVDEHVNINDDSEDLSEDGYQYPDGYKLAYNHSKCHTSASWTRASSST
mmetsp:Transcript_19326/g.57423  ORF Transcript_19326/g.57423 Transcript_19326/m.57423 type:complete len:174 (-) Transcript_19326:210-731(-)